MKAFQYAAPRQENDVLGLLSAEWGHTELLAGGTDLVGLMKKMVITPDLVVNLMEVDSMRGIETDSSGATIGAITNLDDMLDSPELDDYTALKQAIRGISSMQLQAQATVGGELCRRPQCWYFRNGHGLLAERGQMVTDGDNRFHAIFGNAGPAKFVSGSRLAPALIASDARVRIVGPTSEDDSLLPLEFFYRIPKEDNQRETVLEPNQVLTHVHLPPADGLATATYEVRHGSGPEHPLCAAAAALRIEGGIVTDAKIVLGQVAPVPWVSPEAAAAIIGEPVNAYTALAAGEAATAKATPLSGNRHKVQLARVSVQRAILLAAGLETGGF